MSGTGDRDHDVPVHTDLHVRNMLVDGDRISGLIDFEGFRLASADVELDMLLRSVRWALASPITRSPGYEMVPRWLGEDYPGLFAPPRLIERLEVYGALWHLKGSASDPAIQMESLLNGQVRETLIDLLGTHRGAFGGIPPVSSHRQSSRPAVDLGLGPVTGAFHFVRADRLETL